ncbi:ribosome small subunit-dependent GTPase A, partial [Streptosporangium algeriense]
VVGPTGAGKSTLGNALLGEERLATGTVRAQDGKGRHTTVRRELIPLPGGGVLIDTPGLRGISLHDAADGLEQVFAEIEELAAYCRFGDCAHDTEPGCAVQAAIQAGELPERRLRSYRKLQRENAWAAARTDARLRDERVNRQKVITSHLRATYRFRDQQP